MGGKYRVLGANGYARTGAMALLLLAFGCAGFLLGAQSQAEVALKPVTPLLSSGVTALGEEIRYPTVKPAKVTAAAVVSLAPGQETGWHTHGVPVFGYVLQGEVSVDYGARGVKVFREGEALLEAMAVAHNGRNSGSGPLRILAVFIGEEGAQTSVPAEATGAPKK